MNILHVVDERWDSGIVNYALTLAKGLAQKNHHVTVAVQGKKPPAVLAREMGLDLFEITGLASWCSLYFHMIKKNIEIINAHTGRSHTWASLVKKKNMRVIRTRGDARLPKNRFLKNHCIILSYY